MRRKSLILILFMLVLFQIPQTYAAYGDESPDSITSFSETLPDETLFYPDAFRANIETADYGEISDESYSEDYIKTRILDNDPFTESGATDIEIWFEIDTTEGFEGFSYAMYLYADSQTDCDLAFYNFDSSTFVKVDEPLPANYDWMNGTIYDPDFWNTTHIASSIFELSGTADFYWDYGEVVPLVMHLADANHYAEGFGGVSDWVGYGTEGDDSFTSDGDVGTIVYADADNSDYWQYDLTDLVRTNYYVEIRTEYNTTAYGSKVSLILVKGGLFGAGGTSAQAQVLGAVSGWLTTKFIITATDIITAIAFYMGDADGGYELDGDYLRISPANETGGWQHDGSTTEGYNEIYNGGPPTYSSDGDVVQVTGSVSSYAGWEFDTTVLNVDTNYYQFLELKIAAGVGVMRILCWDSDDVSLGALDLVSGDISHTWQTVRVNMLAWSSGATIKKMHLYTNAVDDSNTTMMYDYLKFYSIANFTVTQSGSCNAADVAYVESESLVFSRSTVYHLSFDYDPVLSVAVALYPVWNLTMSWTDTEIIDFRFKPTVGGVKDWTTNTDETRGTWTETGTLTDIELTFYEEMVISEIKFIDTRDWQDVDEVEFVIPVGWSAEFEFGYDAFFIFLGLVMIVASTMYLVRGGKDEMSSNKFFYFVIMFIMGWALFVGGIMP